MNPLRGGDAPQLSGKRVLETTPSGLGAEGADGGSSPRQGRPLRDQRSPAFWTLAEEQRGLRHSRECAVGGGPQEGL